MNAIILRALLLAGSFLTSQIPDASTQARDAVNKGVSAFRHADYESAVAFFTQAVQFDPNMSAAQLYLATAYAQRYVPGVRTRDNFAFADNAIAVPTERSIPPAMMTTVIPNAATATIAV